jgi:ubiquitin carboxyl-terminal hydrolase 25/28
MPYLRESSDLYSILESAYDLTAVEGTDVFQYTEIRTIPHILHISVERARNDGTKCEEPLELPEKVYMDRFMLRPEILAKRRKAWSWKAELANLQQRREVLTKTSTDLNIPQTLSSTSEYLEEIAMNAEDLGLDVALMSDPELLAALGDSAESAQKEMNELDTEISVLEQKLKNLFADHTDFPYRLHAVFMHRSGSGRVDGGHWFIYIFDPKSKQWRRYNDESVQKVTDSHVFLKPTKEAARREGTASFVVYVRDDIADDLMETVYRVPEAEPEMTEVASEIPSADRGLPDWQAANALQQMASQAENYDVPRIPLDVWDHDMSGSGWT